MVEPDTHLPTDPTTQSNYVEVVSESVDFNWFVDFNDRIIKGSATHHLKVHAPQVSEIVFDTLDLVIEAVHLLGTTSLQLEYDVREKHPVMGSALRISLPYAVPSQSTVVVRIEYRTTKECIALQWLDKTQTQGKTFPYLFSQCQPNYARSLAPLQDTPSVKMRYSAAVTCVLPVLMSAVRISPSADGPAHDRKTIGKEAVTYRYQQHVPIPSYLIAIACGNVRYRPFAEVPGRNWTTGVWAEPEIIDAAHWEFSEDTGRFLSVAEDMVTPYRFGVYDLLVLPPSFPYGGMENACLTFLTPTLITGDRSLVDVVVHELTHSWFGNGVTHAHASHFWLNEGWTTYIERVLQRILHSEAHRGFSFLIGMTALNESLREYQDRPKYQRLVIDFEKGEDPDDAYSNIPYEKGSNFILLLERTLGGLDVFLPYVRDYVTKFMGKSITTEQWRTHLYEYFELHGGDEAMRALNSVDFEGWLKGEGLALPVEMEYDRSLAKAAYELADRWNQSRDLSIFDLDFKEADTQDFNSNQKIVFVERLLGYPSLPSTHIAHLGKLYGLSTSSNAEIRQRFYELALQDSTSESAQTFAPLASKWVVGEDGTGIIKGRMKFCRPMFRAIFKVDCSLAVGVFTKFKDQFHPIARKMIEKDLGIA